MDARFYIGVCFPCQLCLISSYYIDPLSGRKSMSRILISSSVSLFWAVTFLFLSLYNLCLKFSPLRSHSSHSIIVQFLPLVVKMHTLFALRSIAVSSFENSPIVTVTNHHMEVCLFSQQDNVSIPVLPTKGRHSLFPQSPTLSPFGFPYGRFTLRTGRDKGLPSSA